MSTLTPSFSLFSRSLSPFPLMSSWVTKCLTKYPMICLIHEALTIHCSDEQHFQMGSSPGWDNIYPQSSVWYDTIHKSLSEHHQENNTRRCLLSYQHYNDVLMYLMFPLFHWVRFISLLSTPYSPWAISLSSSVPKVHILTHFASCP